MEKWNSYLYVWLQRTNYNLLANGRTKIYSLEIINALLVTLCESQKQILNMKIIWVIRSLNLFVVTFQLR